MISGDSKWLHVTEVCNREWMPDSPGLCVTEMNQLRDSE